ncbi:GtrA family protein [Sphingomonas sp.]|uniref:GtrA family protein n=1 Tax=Sphingomonas sp. TaxID=28214 RepID=UPI0025F5EEAF|nr:GtrA family protein [Sphingomonas sp.]
MLSQLLRFLISGALVTILGVAVYALVAVALRWHPQLGNLLAYLVAMATGYVMHSRWSFRDHGQRTKGTAVRFVVVSLISLGLNSLWIALVTGPLGLGPEWPILPMLFVTPAVTFLLNRHWVFG